MNFLIGEGATKCKRIQNALKILSAFSLLAMTLGYGSLSISNYNGFESSPVVDHRGIPLTKATGGFIAVGTFVNLPVAIVTEIDGSIKASEYQRILDNFIVFSSGSSFWDSTAPFYYSGIFSFQDNRTVSGSLFDRKPIYAIIVKGNSLESASEVMVIKTDEFFEGADDENPFPRTIGLGASSPAIQVIGERETYSVNASILDSDTEADSAYSLIEIQGHLDTVVAVRADDEPKTERGPIDLGFVSPGNYSDHVFTILTESSSDSKTVGAYSVRLSGMNADEFMALVDPGTPSDGKAAISFQLRFEPVSGGIKSAVAHFYDKELDENLFDIPLVGNALSFEEDSDGDGLNDTTEWELRELGFEWNRPQFDRVELFLNSAAKVELLTESRLRAERITGQNEVTADPGKFGLFTLSQLELERLSGQLDVVNNPDSFSLIQLDQVPVLKLDQIQLLKLEAPIIARDPGTGYFTLIMVWKQSSNLQHFTDLPASMENISVNQNGDIEFKFASDEVFFRLESY